MTIGIRFFHNEKQLSKVWSNNEYVPIIGDKLVYGGKLFTVMNRIYSEADDILAIDITTNKPSQDDEYLLYSCGFKETGKR